MGNPTPRLVNGERWRVDFRSAKEFGADYGQHWLKALPADPLGALNEAWHLLGELRARAVAASTQVAFDFSNGPTFKVAAAELLERRIAREEPKAETEAYLRKQWKCAIREFGHLHFAAFAPPVGTEFLADQVIRWRREGLKPPTRANRLSVIRQVLDHAWDRQWLPRLPRFPRPTVGKEVMRVPVYDWQTEAEFRVMRDRLWEDRAALGRLMVVHKSAGGVDDYVARRRLYMSFGFYIGAHTINLDGLLSDHVGADVGTFERINTKSAACVPPVTLEMPERLWLDVQEEIRRLKRPWRRGEAIAGGRWSTVARVCRDEAARLNLRLPVGPRIWRRSVAYHLALLGWSEADTAEYLGHVDQRMVREVYRRIPLRRRSPVKLEWTIANMAKVTGSMTAHAVVFDFERERAAHRGGPGLHAVESRGPEVEGPAAPAAGTRAAKSSRRG